MDPVGLAPIFYVLTGNYPEERKKRIIHKTLIVVLTTLLTFAFFGTWIFKFFGITINSFKLAGGLLLLKIAWDMLHAEISGIKQTSKEEKELEYLENIAVVPLGILLLAGPGTITTTIILMDSANTVSDKITVLISILLVSMISGIMLYLSEPIAKALKTSGINAIVRLMGLILAAISIEIIFSGTYGMIKTAVV